MNTHQREWIVTVVSAESAGASTLREFCAALIPRTRVRWNTAAGTERHTAYGRFITPVKHFATEIDEAGSKESGSTFEPAIVREGGSVRYEYPIYIGHLATELSPAFFVTAPYVALNREIWKTSRLAANDLHFLAPKIDKVFGSLLRHSPPALDEALAGSAPLTVLRGARVNITDDQNLRGAVLVGENVMRSELYKHLAPSLDGTGPVSLADAVAKVGFWGVLRRRIVVHMDRFGNFRIRPGMGGTRLIYFSEFVAHLQRIKAFTWRNRLPLDRVLDLAGESAD